MARITLYVRALYRVSSVDIEQDKLILDRVLVEIEGETASAPALCDVYVEVINALKFLQQSVLG